VFETIEDLIRSVKLEAERAEFPIDVAVYDRAARDSKTPILFAGSLDASTCIVGRDLGADEVHAGQPLIGAAGRMVRKGIARAWCSAPQSGENIQPADFDHDEGLRHVLLSNTVPFKPPGNKAYTRAVRQRFRPFLERLLAEHWKGHQVITLGTEAFLWFEPYADPSAFEAIKHSDSRFDVALSCWIPADPGRPNSTGKAIQLYPLPHPSPLNRRWYSRFPEMLSRRLGELSRHDLAMSTKPARP
jgi:uracil-DNA glycosylase